MTPGIITLTFFILWAAGVSESVLITQWPRYISSLPGSPAEIQCYQNDTDHSYTYWYRKPRGKGLELMVVVVANLPQFEDGFKSGFKTAAAGKLLNLTISSIEEKDEAVYFCATRRQGTAGAEAYFGGGTKLTVLETDLEVTPPTNVKILPPSPNECRNQKDKKRKKTLVCVASGFYPDHVEVLWKTNGKEAKDGVATDSAAKRVDKFYRITSRLRVPAEDYNTASNTFTCIVSFFNGEKKILREASINGTQDKTEGGMTREKYLRLTQSAKLSYVVVIVKSCFYGVFVGVLVWKLQGSARKHH